MSKEISQVNKPIYEFGPFQADLNSRTLKRDGEPVFFPSKAFDLLTALLEQNGETIEKDELMRKVWPDSFVEEINLLVQVSALRKALGDSARSPRYVATISKRGYRFIGDVRLIPLAEEGGRAEDSVGAPDLKDEEAAPPPEPDLGEPASVQSFARPPAGEKKSTRSRAAILFLLLAAALGALIYSWRMEGGQNKPPLEQPPLGARKLIIFPFKALGLGEDSRLGVEIADALKSRLGGISPITAWPADSIRLAEEWPKDPLEAARQMGAGLFVNGTVRRADDRLQVTAQLIRAEDGAPLWADEFSYKSADLFAAREVVAGRLSDGLAPRITGTQRVSFSEESSGNLKAYELLLRGRFFQQKRTRPNLKESVRFFEEAIREDPNYAYAYGELAYSYYALRVSRTLSTEEAMPRAIASAVRAVEMDDNLGWVHGMLGLFFTQFEWDWERAEESFKRATDSAPDVFSRVWYSRYLILMGRADEARAQIERALEENPDSLDAMMALANHFYLSGQYDEAMAQLKRAAALFPTSYAVNQGLGAVHREKGLHAESVAAYERAVKLAAEKMLWDDGLPELATAYAAAGRRAEALKLLARIKGGKSASPYSLAQAYAGLGDTEESIKFLFAALNKRDPELPWVTLDPVFKGVRADPRFSMLKRMMRL